MGRFLDNNSLSIQKSFSLSEVKCSYNVTNGCTLLLSIREIVNEDRSRSGGVDD